MEGGNWPHLQIRQPFLLLLIDAERHQLINLLYFLYFATTKQ